MKKSFGTIFSLLTGVFLLFFLWGIYFLFSLSFIKSDLLSSPYFIPENAELIVEVNGGNVVKDVLFGVLIEGKGGKIPDKIRELSKKDSGQKQYGINWVQPFIYFKAPYKGKLLQGLIVQIVDPLEWNENINTLFGNTSVAKRKGNFGIVVQSDELTKTELYAFTGEQAAEKSAGKQYLKDKDFISVSRKSDNTDAGLDISVEGNIISSKGIINHDGTLKSNRLNFVLVPSDLHFTSDLVTNELRDTLAGIIGFDLFPNAVSVNYRGVAITEINKKTVLLPDADFVFGFEKETSLQQFTENISHAGWEEENRSVKIGKQIYFVKQLDERSIFFGVRQNVELKENHQPIGVLLSGSLKPLVNVQGNRWIRTVMRMNPALSFGMDLAEEVEFCLIRLEAIDAKSFQLTASVRFKNEDEAVLKLLELILKRQV